MKINSFSFLARYSWGYRSNHKSRGYWHQWTSALTTQRGRILEWASSSVLRLGATDGDDATASDWLNKQAPWATLFKRQLVIRDALLETKSATTTTTTTTTAVDLLSFTATDVQQIAAVCFTWTIERKTSSLMKRLKKKKNKWSGKLDTCHSVRECSC